MFSSSSATVEKNREFYCRSILQEFNSEKMNVENNAGLMVEVHFYIVWCLFIA